MRNLLLIILLTLFSFGFAFSAITTVQVLIVIGQSNASGRGEVARLANTQYNYKGISTGYPSVRTTQAQYVANPTGVYTYWKGMDKTPNFQALDNGSWVSYQAGVNSQFDLAAVPTYHVFGPELSLAQQIRDATGQEVFIIKPAIGGTGLTNGLATTAPGEWNFVIRNIATEFFIRRAIRDLKTFRPNVRINLAGVVWWQGEQDAVNNVSAATYKSEFYDMKAVIDGCIRETFNLTKPYLWNLVKVDYLRTSGETTINTALAAIVSERSDCRLIDGSSYPRKQNLSSAEASPITVGNPNSAGGVDDPHKSYIAQLAVGELMFANMQGSL